MTTLTSSSASDGKHREDVTLPEDARIVQVDDLNGKYAPQGEKTIQPEIATIPEPLQVNFTYPADLAKDNRPVVSIDDWVTTATDKTANLEAQPYDIDSLTALMVEQAEELANESLSPSEATVSQDSIESAETLPNVAKKPVNSRPPRS